MSGRRGVISFSIFISVGAIDSGDYVVGVRQFFTAIEFGTNQFPILTVASVALDFVALQRSRTVQGLVVFMPAAAKLAGEGGFFFDLHYVIIVSQGVGH